MNAGHAYTVKNDRFRLTSDNSIIKLSQGQRWDLVDKPCFAQRTIQRENVIMTIHVSDFKDIFGEE